MDRRSSPVAFLPSLVQGLLAIVLGLAWAFFGALLFAALLLSGQLVTLPTLLITAGLVVITTAAFTRRITGHHARFIRLTCLVGFFSFLFIAFIFVLAWGVSANPNG